MLLTGQEFVVLSTYLSEDLLCSGDYTIGCIIFYNIANICKMPFFSQISQLLILFFFLIRKLVMKVCQRSKVYASCFIYWILSFMRNTLLMLSAAC